jgi:hypothetical protein
MVIVRGDKVGQSAPFKPAQKRGRATYVFGLKPHVIPVYWRVGVPARHFFIFFTFCITKLVTKLLSIIKEADKIYFLRAHNKTSIPKTNAQNENKHILNYIKTPK